MSEAMEPQEPRDEDEEEVVAGSGRSPERDRRRDPFADLGLDQAAMDEVRKAVHERVFSAFRGSVDEHDIKDAIAMALLALVKEHLENPVRDLRAFTAEVGFRAARELICRPWTVPFDPLDSPVLEQEDHAPSVVERIDDRAQLARIAEALEQLDDDKLAAFHLRVIEDLPHEEACRRLGLGRSAYFERVKAAKESLEGAMDLTSHVFERRQRQLLSDYVAGIAVDRERRRAERLIAADPHAAALARELRRGHDAAALLLPPLSFSAAVEQDTGGRLAALADRARDLLSDWHGRGLDPGEVASSPALTSGGARGAGAAGAGLIAKAFGGLGAGNIAVACLGGGAVATIACVATGVLPLPGPSDEPKPDPVQAHEVRAPEQAARVHAHLPELIAREPAAPTPTPPKRSAGSAEGDQPSGPAPEPAPEPTLEPDVAPEVQEFGVAGAGTPVGGAPPDTNQADGASASSVRQEFGP